MVSVGATPGDAQSGALGLMTVTEKDTTEMLETDENMKLVINIVGLDPLTRGHA